MKERLDNEVVKRGLLPTRTKAQAAIMAGKVNVNGQQETKAGRGVKETDRIELLADACPYVSRGGIKLKSGLDNFAVSPAGKICLDVGVATGGFTDCMLQNGAARVYAVDVGRGQIDQTILNNPAVVFMPETNARFLKPDAFPQPPALVAIDVSFISLKMILGPVVEASAHGADIIALIKPQFELTPKQVPHGIVASDEFRREAVTGLQKFLEDNIKSASGLEVIESPIKGAKGNIEFLWHIKKS